MLNNFILVYHNPNKKTRTGREILKIFHSFPKELWKTNEKITYRQLFKFQQIAPQDIVDKMLILCYTSIQ